MEQKVVSHINNMVTVDSWFTFIKYIPDIYG